MKFKKGSEPQCYALARKQKYHYRRHPQPRPAMTDIPAVPTLPQIPSLGELGSVGGGAPREGVVMPLSVSDRVSLVRNNMYENFLQKSTQKLQEEIHHTMKMYSVEKQQLMTQLATLRHDMADLKISESGAHRNGTGNHHGKMNADLQKVDGSHRSSDSGVSSIQHFPGGQKGFDYGGHDNDNHRHSDVGAGDHVPRSLPPINGIDPAEHLTSELLDEDYFSRSSTEFDLTGNSASLNMNEKDSELKLNIFSEKKSQRKKKTPKEVPALRLPQIKEEAPRPDWCSGDNSMTLKHKDFSSLTALPQIKEMKAISETNYDIPVVKDSIRCEISLPTKPTIKKVHFSGSNSIQELTPRTSLPQIQKKKFQMSKPTKRNQRASLPSLTTNEGSDQKQEEVLAQGSEGNEKWKSVYVNIHDPEQRTKTLGDILYAVRVRMRENEQRLMYGHHSTEDKKDPTLCDYLLVHKEDRDRIRRTKKKPSHKRSLIPNHTAERLHRRSNAVQLQNYLKKLSRERRMIEHMEGEEYRLTHIVGHRQLQEAAQKSVQ